MRLAHDQFDDSIGKHSAKACCDNNRFKPEQPIVAKQSVVAVQHTCFHQNLDPESVNYGFGCITRNNVGHISCDRTAQALECETVRKVFTILFQSQLKLPHILGLCYVISHVKLDQKVQKACTKMQQLKNQESELLTLRQLPGLELEC